MSLSRLVFILFALVTCTSAAQSTRPRSGPVQSTQISEAVSAQLLAMAAHASVLFTGQVMRIDAAEGIVDTRFRILQCLRNCPSSGIYVLREWAGLWASNPARYQVGERRLMLLHARSPAGLSSPVGGTDGAILLRATGNQPLANAAGEAPADTAAPLSLAADLAILQARTLRTSAASSNPAPRLAAASAPDWPGPTAPLSSSPQTPDLASLLALLTSPSAAAPARENDARF